MPILNQQQYEGCTVFIRDENSDATVRTTIVVYFKGSMTIQVRASLKDFSVGMHVVAVILSEHGVHEYRAVVRKITPTMSELSLYKGMVKQESRTATRYPVNAPATVVSLIAEARRMPLHTPLEVYIVNISTSGVLFRSKPDYFALEAIVELHLQIDGKVMILDATVVRMTHTDNTTTDYGCKFIELEI